MNRAPVQTCYRPGPTTEGNDEKADFHGCDRPIPGGMWRFLVADDSESIHGHNRMGRHAAFRVRDGPDNCWVRQQRATWTPAVFTDLPMTVTRDARSIMIKGDFFQVNYEGIVRANAFFANGTVPLTGAPSYAVAMARDPSSSYLVSPGSPGCFQATSQ